MWRWRRRGKRRAVCEEDRVASENTCVESMVVLEEGWLR